MVQFVGEKVVSSDRVEVGPFFFVSPFCSQPNRVQSRESFRRGTGKVVYSRKAGR